MPASLANILEDGNLQGSEVRVFIKYVLYHLEDREPGGSSFEFKVYRRDSSADPAILLAALATGCPFAPSGPPIASFLNRRFHY